MNRFQLISSLFLFTTLLPFSYAQERRQVVIPEGDETIISEVEVAELANGPKATITPVEPEVDEPEEIVEQLLLVEDSADQVLILLEQWTGKIILRRQDLPVTKISFDSRGSLTKREAVLALESLLTLNGVMLTDMGGRFMKAVPATNVNTHVPQMIAGSTLGLDASQQIYAKLFKFDYLNAEQSAAPLIQPMLSQNSSVVPFPKSNALLVTDALINLQRIEEILSEADKSQDVRESIQFIKLDYVQAAEMKERIDNLIEGPLKNYLEGNTNVTADERTNQLILITHPGNVGVIMDVIEKVDVDAAPLTSSEVFPLKQAKAEEVVPIIEEIISGQKEGREEDAEVARENQQDNRNNNRNNNNNGTSITVNVPSSSGGTEVNSSLQFSNFVGLAADERTNSIVAYGTEQDLKTLKDLIEKIDIPLPQVLIEAVITQVTLSENQASGLGTIGFTYDGATNTLDAISAGLAGGISFSGGRINLDDPSDFNLTTAINPTNQDGDTRVLSTPRITVSHNEEGVINVSRSQPIITASTTSGQSTSLNTRSSVEYRDIGIKLTVTPLIGADGTVQMVIEQTVEDILGEVEIDGNPQPIIGVREANSTISVKDGQIIVLGGLQENSVADSNSYFPLVGRMPIIRNIFGNSGEDYEREELVIFIRPTILSNPEKADTLAHEYIENASEAGAIREYIETNTLGDIYMEGSRFEKEEEKPAINTPKPRSLRRI